MKKLLLAGFVVVTYIAYSVHQRVEGSGTDTPVTLGGSTTPAPTPTLTAGQYKNGQYTGGITDAYYGNVQVKATVQGGQLTDVTFLEYPSDRSTSIRINSQAMPYLKQEALTAQSGKVDGVSGATYTSQAFVESLTSALSSARL